MDYLEIQSRRNNLVINDLGADKEDETWDETEGKVLEMFTTSLKMETSVEIERAHRNGKFRGNGEKPRTEQLFAFKGKNEGTSTYLGLLINVQKLFNLQQNMQILSKSVPGSI